MKKKAILFDFGGTLDTNGVHWCEKFWEIYQKFNLDISKLEYEGAYIEAEGNVLSLKSLSNMTFNEILEKQIFFQFKSLSYLPNPWGSSSNNDFIEKISDYCYNEVKEVIGSSRDILSKLHEYYCLGVVSNFYGNLEKVCKEFELDQYFEVYADSAVIGIRKPDPKIFSYALDKLGIAANDSYVVGDSYDRDIIPSKQIGCNTIWLDGKSWTKPVDISKADYTVKNLSEILMILLK